MSLHHNPRIVTDGLVLAYDMDNAAKSFKGKPTTNLTTNTPTQAGWQGNYSLVSSDTKTFDVTTQQNNSSNTSAWRTWYWDVSSYEGSTITISGDVQFLEANDAEFLHITIGQGNTGSFPVHIAGSNAADKVQISTRPDQKIHMTWTGTINSAGLVGFTQWINNVTADGGNSTLRISNIQIEVNGFETPFVNGTRGNYESLIDLSKNGYQVGADYLGYESDGTFSFDGVDQNFYILNLSSNAPEIYNIQNNLTMEFAFYPEDSGDTGAALCRCGLGTDLTFGFFHQRVNNQIYLHWYNTSGSAFDVSYSDSGVTTNNAWNIGTIVRDGTTAYFYINGNLVTTNTGLSLTSESPTHIGFGATRAANYVGTTAQDFAGKISSAKIYNRALTAAEIKQNFNANRGRFGI